MTKNLGLLAILTLTACADEEPADVDILCTYDGVEYRASEGYTDGDCTDVDGDVNAGPGIAAKIDISKPFVDLGVLGADWMYQLGGNAEFTTWDPLVVRSGPIGYNLLGGSEDWDPSHAVAFITKTVNVDVEGDGIVDKVYEAIPIPETPEGGFFQGTYVNFDNPDCAGIGNDAHSEYEELAGCYAMYAEVCGAEFTAYDMEEANRGECGLSVIANDGKLTWGPTVSTF